MNSIIIKDKKLFYKKFIDENSLPSKLIIFFISQGSNLLLTMSEINNIIELNNPEIIPFIYSARKTVHKILYNEEESIDIKFDKEKLKLPYLFFLSLLIKDEPEILNYTYPFNFIEENNKEIRKLVNKNQLKIILKCKINIELIINFRGIDHSDEDSDFEILDKIENENKNIIRNNLNFLKNLNLFYNDDDIIEKPIDELYTEIIISLIKQKKFEDYEFAYNILSQMDIENIPITETMSKKLHKLFNSNEDYITDYTLNKKEDLLNENKINFFYILLKYILKKLIYIYQNPFLYQQKKFILNLYKTGELFNITKGKIDNKLEYFLRMMLDSAYYFKGQYEQLNEVLIYFKNFFFESKKKEIDQIEDIIKNNKMGYYKYLDIYDDAKFMNIRKDIINYLFELKNNNEEGNIKNSVDEWKYIEEMVNEKRIEEIDTKKKELLINYFKDPSKYNELKNIFTQDAFNYFKNKLVELESKSTKFASSMAVVNKKENKEENLDADKPLSEIIKDAFIPFLLTNLEIFLHTNKKDKKDEKEKKDYFVYDKISCGTHHIEISYDLFLKNKWKSKEKQENNLFDSKKEKQIVYNIMKFYDFLEEFENRIQKEFLYSYNLILKLDFTIEKVNVNSNPEIENITCIYTFYNPINFESSSFKQNNILMYGINSSIQGFEFLIYDMNNEIYKDCKYIEFNFKDEKSKLKDNKKDNVEIEFSPKMNKIFEDSELDEMPDEYEIIKLKKIIGHHLNTADFIIELKNGYFISGGFNKELKLYDRQFIKKVDIGDFKDYIYSIFGEKETENYIEFNVCTYKDLTLINIDLQSFTARALKVFEIPNRVNIYCIEMKQSDYIILGPGGSIFYVDLYNDDKVDQFKITEKTYSSGSKINDTIACLASNQLLIEGEDKILFYNTESKEICDKKVIEGFSFNISINCLYLFKKESKSSNGASLLFCACKKYKEDQENGILIVEIDLNKEEKYKHTFYKTNFEVYCFCSISKITNNNEYNNEINIDDEYRQNVKTERTVYLLIGGFDKAKRQGTIKLYKIIINSEETQIENNSEETRIKYMQDITIDDDNNYEYFNGAISCIIQSSLTGLILATCENGNVYLFSKPNIDYYLNLDREENT